MHDMIGVEAERPEVVIARGAEISSTRAFVGLARKVMAYNELLMLTEHVMEAGAVFPAHSHPHEQLAYLVSGRIQVRCGDRVFEATGGDSFIVRGGVEHEVHAIERSVALDIFTPSREDYLAQEAKTR